MTRSHHRRPGFSLVELLAVFAILVILGALAGPSLIAMSGNAKQKAAADVVRSRMADARGRAMSDGKAYRLAIHADGTRIRLAPDGPDFASPASAPADGSAMPLVLEDSLNVATAGIDQGSDDMMSSDGGWNTVATFLPDGTCREATVTVTIREEGYPPLLIHLRGLTGVTKTTTSTAGAKP